MSSQYLQSVINGQRTSFLAPANALAHFTPLIRQWAGAHLNSVTISGSNAKGTAVNSSADIDLFISLSSSLNWTLTQIYDSLYNYFSSLGYNPRKQNVSIRVNYPGGSVDLVPGRQQPGWTSDHSLHVRRNSQGWTKTNVQQHISLISSSGKQNLIKLVKIWRDCNNLQFPSLYLELCVLEATHGQWYTGLEQEFRSVMTWLYNYIENRRIVDPANTNNVLSNDLTASEKKAIKLAAAIAATTTNLHQVVY